MLTQWAKVIYMRKFSITGGENTFFLNHFYVIK